MVRHKTDFVCNTLQQHGEYDSNLKPEVCILKRYAIIVNVMHMQL
jgi:hypothetical protein